MPITFNFNDYQDLMRKPEIMDRIVRVNRGDTVTFEKGRYRGVSINVVSNLRDFRKNLRKIKGIILHGEEIRLIGQKENGNAGAVFTDHSSISIFSPNVTVEGFTFKKGGYIDANIRQKFATLLPTGANILNNDFIGGRGYAKRIKVGSTSEHEALKMNILIQGNQFVKIKGENNNGNPGGEIISIKSGSVRVVQNQFKNCIGQLSLRGGVGNTAEGNTFSGRSRKGGIQVYGNGSLSLNL